MCGPSRLEFSGISPVTAPARPSAMMTWRRSPLPPPCSCCIQYLHAMGAASRNKLRGLKREDCSKSHQNPWYSRFLPGFDTLSCSSSGFYAFSDPSWRGSRPTTEYETTPLLHTQAVERTVKTVTVDSSLLLGSRQGGETLPSHRS